MAKGDTRFECLQHGPIPVSSCWACAASGEMTSRVQVDMSKPVYVPPLPTAERIAQIRADYEAHRACAETYGCKMDAKDVRDVLAVLDATADEWATLRAAAEAFCDAIDRAEGLEERVRLRVPPDMMAAYSKLRRLTEVTWPRR